MFFFSWLKINNCAEVGRENKWTTTVSMFFFYGIESWVKHETSHCASTEILPLHPSLPNPSCRVLHLQFLYSYAGLWPQRIRE